MSPQPDDAFDDVSDEVSADLDDVASDTQALIDTILDGSGETVRMAIRYSGDDYEVEYLRDDIAAQFTDDELAERVKTLTFKGLGDPTEEGPLFDFGQLAATVRWYDDVVVAHFPVREWSGLIFTFDRVTDSLLDVADEHFKR